MYDKKKHSVYATLKLFRQRLYKNDLIILVQDFGAGSRVFKSNARQISKVAKTAGITKKHAELLYRISSYLKPKNILELGTSLGMATSALSLGNLKGDIVTIEGCQETAQVAKAQFEHFQLKNIELINSEFNIALNLEKIRETKFDLVYIDGNHNKKATLDYFNILLSNINNDSIMIFDDIHWSKDMTEAWEAIKQHPQVKVTVDIFYWGLVFFRKEQEKEHFSIRV